MTFSTVLTLAQCPPSPAELSCPSLIPSPPPVDVIFLHSGLSFPVGTQVSVFSTVTTYRASARSLWRSPCSSLREMRYGKRSKNRSWVRTCFSFHCSFCPASSQGNVFLSVLHLLVHHHRTMPAFTFEHHSESPELLFLMKNL